MSQTEAAVTSENDEPFKQVWQRWLELTRFRLACEMALSAYRKSFVELPIRGIEATNIFDERGISRFECSYDEFLSALTDESYLYQLLLIAHISLVEEFGRTIVGMLVEEGMARSAFPSLDTAAPVTDAVEAYIMRCSVETWGTAIMASTGKTWADVPDLKARVVQAFVTRNILAHGAKAFNRTAVNRLTDADVSGVLAIKEGDALVLDREAFQQLLSALRGFARLICGVPSRVRRNTSSPEA